MNAKAMNGGCRLLLLVAALYGCGGGGGPAGTADVAIDALAGDAAVADIVPDDASLPDDVTPDVATPDSATPDNVYADADVAFVDEVEPPPGCEPCATGVCIVLAADDRVCAEECVQGQCPQGYECRAAASPNGLIQVCVPGAERLCRPCRKTAECLPWGVPTLDVCASWGSAGSFCARDCSLQTCPAGFECRDVPPVEGGAVVRQCLPAAGAECACFPSAIADGASTVCSVTDSYGTCNGTRRCQADGLTACDAKLATAETCDGKDEDCDGSIDEDIPESECMQTYGTISCRGPRVCQGGQLVCLVAPPTTESCNGLDDDCDGTTDPDGSTGCVDTWIDADGDEAGTGTPRCLCTPEAPWTAKVDGDCNDGDAAIRPGAVETCNGIDDDCDGSTDPEDADGCTTYYLDMDKDGCGATSVFKCLCGPTDSYLATISGDCDETDPHVSPLSPEACNGLDDDCDGSTDEGEGGPGCTMFYKDLDGDGYGSLEGMCLCKQTGVWAVVTGGDCNDAAPLIHPGAAEVCNGQDENCNGLMDDGFPCVPGDVGKEACGTCGSRTRTCTSACTWDDWSACTGAGVCTPGDTKACTDMCGTLSCQTGCAWGTACAPTLDAYEPNDDKSHAYSCGSFTEPSHPSTKSGWIHSATDIDWFRFRGTESDSLFDYHLAASASLSVAQGWHKLCVYWDLNANGSTDASQCVEGYGTLYAATYDLDVLGSTQYGDVYVTVQGDWSCSGYTLWFGWD